MELREFERERPRVADWHGRSGRPSTNSRGPPEPASLRERLRRPVFERAGPRTDRGSLSRGPRTPLRVGRGANGMGGAAALSDVRRGGRPLLRMSISATGAVPMPAYASLPDHLGVARRLNELRAMALTPLLARMDADDVMSPTRLAEQVAFLTATPEVGVLGGWAGTFLDGPDGDVVVAIDRPPTDHESIVRALKTRNPLIHGTVMARRDVFSLVGGYDESLQAAQDYDLWTRLAPHVRFRNLPTVLIRRRLHPTQVSQHRRRERWRVEAMARLRGGATPYKQLAGLLFKR